MSFIMGSCDGDGVAQRKLSIHPITARPATVIVEQPFLGVLRTHRWRGCMYRFGERLYCIQPRKPEIVNVCALCR